MAERGFKLDVRLESDSHPVAELPLCMLRLMDDARYPWLVLVPRRQGVTEWLDLDAQDAYALHEEVLECCAVLRAMTGADKLNVAALGNVVAQLHVHVIARFREDDAWPRPVWGVHPARPRKPQNVASLVRALRILLEVRRVPQGRVSTYGAIARRAGVRSARLVGTVLSNLADSRDIPWHRIVGSDGRPGLSGETASEQLQRLAAEGVQADGKGRYDLRRYSTKLPIIYPVSVCRGR